MPPLYHIVPGRSDGDCTIAVLAMFLPRPYEDVLEAASRVARAPHRQGMTTREMAKVARVFGVTLAMHQPTEDDYDTTVGIAHLSPKSRRGDWHVAILDDGKIYDVDATVWDVRDYLQEQGWRLRAVLTRG